MIKRFLIFSLAIFSILSFNSCEKEIDERLDDELIRLKAYIRVLKRNNPTLQIDSTKSGLYYIIESQGTGNIPVKDNYLLFDYTEQNLDEEVFKSSLKSISELHDSYSIKVHYAPKFIKYKDEMNPLLAGVAEGFSLLKEGGKIRLIMPSNLAYGSSISSHIGKTLNPFTSLIVDIDFKRLVTDVVAYEEELISVYLTENYPDLVVNDVLASLKQDGVYVLKEEEKPVDVDEEEEEEEDPYQVIVKDDEVSLDYTGRLTDNWLFDTSVKEVAEANGTYSTSREYKPISVKVESKDFIDGFSLALKKLRTNTKAAVLILSKNAYGEKGSSSEGIETIPPHAPLIFDLDIFKKKAKTTK
jgi:FKBP-type peptidyl-prolyl cis-trans isomerase FklB